MSSRETAKQTAKTLKSQFKTVSQKSQARIVKKNQNKTNKAATYFPEVPLRYFGYTRPAEASKQPETLRELAVNFQGNFSSNLDNAKTQQKKKQKSKFIQSQYEQLFRPE